MISQRRHMFLTGPLVSGHPGETGPRPPRPPSPRAPAAGGRTAAIRRAPRRQPASGAAHGSVEWRCGTSPAATTASRAATIGSGAVG